MKTKSRALISVPIDLEQRSSLEPLADPPKLVVDDVDLSLNMAQVNGTLKDQGPQPQEPSRPGRVISASMRSAALSNSENIPVSDTIWPIAVVPTSTGKSGRVIEKLQAEIDRLRRDNHLIKVQFDEVEKANETLATQNQFLRDRNSNYEASHEANVRQLDRKERQVQDLKEELKTEKKRTLQAEQRAQTAMANEEIWKDQANRATTIAQQKEAEYDTVAACRTTDNAKYQNGLDKVKASFGVLMQQREEDVEKTKKLQIIAEQQRKTIQQLEQLTAKLNANFKAYRTEIDSAIQSLRANAGTNDEAVNCKLQEMEEVTGQMRWIVNVEQVINHKPIPDRPFSRRGEDRDIPLTQDRSPSSPVRRMVDSIDMKGKHGKKKLSRSIKS